MTYLLSLWGASSFYFLIEKLLELSELVVYLAFFAFLLRGNNICVSPLR